MRMIAIVLACLAYTTYGRRLQMPVDRVHDGLQHRKHHESQKAFAELLQAFNNPTGYSALSSRRTDSAQREPPINLPTPRRLLANRFRPLVALEEGEVSESERKRIRVERLKLEAERAALEAEKLQLQAAQMSQLARERRTTEEAAPTPSASKNAAVTSEPLPAPAPAPQLAPSPQPLPGVKTVKIENERVRQDVQRITRMFKGKKDKEVQLTDEQIQLAKTRVFNKDSFTITAVEQTDIGTIFRGGLRTNSSIVIERVNSKLAEVPELRDVRFHLILDPVMDFMEVIEGKEREPLFLALPADAARVPFQFTTPLLSLVGGLSTLVCTVGIALSFYILGDDGAILRAVEVGDIGPLAVAFPIAAALCALQLLHEFAHSLTASAYDMEIGLSTWVPSLQLGTFGSVTRILSPPRNRKALFDFALSGPVFAGLVSFALYVVGLSLSVDFPVPDTSNAQAALESLTQTVSGARKVVQGGYVPYFPPPDLMPVFSTSLLRSSAALGGVAQLMIPAVSTADYVTLHPLALIGFCGTLINALQLIPIGQLDGGRAATALRGYWDGRAVTTTMLILLIVTNFTVDNPVFLFFGLYATLLQRGSDLICADEVTELDSTREAIAFIAAAAVLLTLLPLPISSTAAVTFPGGGTFPGF